MWCHLDPQETLAPATVLDFDQSLTKIHTFSQDQLCSLRPALSAEAAIKKGIADAEANLKDAIPARLYDLSGSHLCAIATYHNNPGLVAGYFMRLLNRYSETHIQHALLNKQTFYHPKFKIAIDQYSFEGLNPLCIGYINAQEKEFNKLKTSLSGKNEMIVFITELWGQHNLYTGQTIEYYDDDACNLGWISQACEAEAFKAEVLKKVVSYKVNPKNPIFTYDLWPRAEACVGTSPKVVMVLPKFFAGLNKQASVLASAYPLQESKSFAPQKANTDHARCKSQAFVLPLNEPLRSFEFETDLLFPQSTWLGSSFFPTRVPAPAATDGLFLGIEPLLHAAPHLVESLPIFSEISAEVCRIGDEEPCLVFSTVTDMEKILDFLKELEVKNICVYQEMYGFGEKVDNLKDVLAEKGAYYRYYNQGNKADIVDADNKVYLHKYALLLSPGAMLLYLEAKARASFIVSVSKGAGPRIGALSI